MSDLIDSVFWTACLIAVVVHMFDSTRRVVLYGPQRRAILVLAGLTLTSIAIGAAYYWMHIKFDELAVNFKGKPFVQLPANWSSEQSAELREKNSRTYAYVAYLGDGVLLKHVDLGGKWIAFHPSQEQMKERESAVANLAKLEGLSWRFAQIAWTWWLSCLFAAAFGWLAARSEGRVGKA
jgi:hypothetical protein